MDRTVSKLDASQDPQHESSTRLSQEANGKQSWTVAIDLSANLRDENGKPNGVGASYKWEQLQKLAGDTAGKPVTLVVSVTEPEETVNSKGKNTVKPGVPAAKGDDDPFVDKLLGLKHPTVDTYMIRDGNVRKVETHKSEGTAQDIDALLKVANSQAPADHRALIIFGHGQGTDFESIQGDAGTAPIGYVRSAIKDGMPKDTPLDLTVFDSCTMASVGTAHAMAGLTDRMVASEDTEFAPKGLPEGINLNATLENLIKNPNMSGKDLSVDFIKEAKKGSDGKPQTVAWDKNHPRAPIDTLVALDLSAYPQFQDSLDKFSAALDKGVGTEQNKNAIAAIADASPSIPSLMPSYETVARDLNQFTTRVLRSISDGKLKDDGSIKSAAESLIKSQAAMTEGYYGSSNYYQKLGGLTIELPPEGKEARLKQVASETVLGQLANFSEALPQLSSRNKLHTAVDLTLKSMERFQTPGIANDLSTLKHAEHSIAAAKTQIIYDTARGELKKAVDEYLTTGFGKSTVENMVQTREKASPTAGRPWAAFVDKLSGLDQLSLDEETQNK